MRELPRAPQHVGQVADSALFPRVAHVMYAVEHGAEVKYAQGARREGKLRGFTYLIEGNTAKFTPAEQVASATEALEVLQPQVDAWNLHNEITRPGSMRLAFRHCRVLERALPAGTLQIDEGIVLGFGVTGTLTATLSNFPAAPESFAVDDCVVDLSAAYLQSVTVPDTILKNAYTMASRLEFEHDGTARAARALNLSYSVLRKLRKLANNRGTAAQVRKYEQRSYAPLSDTERAWLLDVMLCLVQRSGVLAADAEVGPTLTGAHFPRPH